MDGAATVVLAAKEGVVVHYDNDEGVCDNNDVDYNCDDNTCGRVCHGAQDSAGNGDRDNACDNSARELVD